MTAEDAPTHENVRVAVRVRPFVAKERLEPRQSSCLRVHAAERQVVIGKDRAFTFDFVFGDKSEQAQVYDEACAPLVEGCLNGYNATIFACARRAASDCPHFPRAPAPRRPSARA